MDCSRAVLHSGETPAALGRGAVNYGDRDREREDGETSACHDIAVTRAATGSAIAAVIVVVFLDHRGVLLCRLLDIFSHLQDEAVQRSRHVAAGSTAATGA